jgi:glycosyltransferase involved in cell wall biosynthesis
MRIDVVYVNYWSLRDPLCRSQTMPILTGLTALGWRFALITFEQPGWRLSRADAREARHELSQKGIRWCPLNYHRRPPALSTAFDIANGVLSALRIRRRFGVRLFHGRGTVAAGVAQLSARATRTPFFNDADGPLSEEYVDAGIWLSGSLVHRLVRSAERSFLRRADAVAVLSRHRREEVTGIARVPVEILPCAVDTAVFVRDPQARARLRRELDLRGWVLVYAGKLSGWYLGDKVFDFAARARSVLGELTLLVLTGDDQRWLAHRARTEDLRCVIRQVRHEEMPGWLSAADAGLSLRKNSPSQLACSPIKNGEYLACGLPVVTTSGAGDYGELVERRRVGVVLRSLDDESIDQGALALARLLDDPDVGRRCRRAAVEEVGLREIVLPRYEEIYSRLLGSPSGAARQP